jgi:Bacterial dipeptidyl-peptidase Sh3 domain
VIASHYAEPLLRCLATPATLHAGPAADSDAICRLSHGDEMWLLDDTRGWAWGYAGPDRRVGYVRSETLNPC